MCLIFVIYTINKLQHRKCFVGIFIHSLQLTLENSLVRCAHSFVFQSLATRELKSVRRTFYEVIYLFYTFICALSQTKLPENYTLHSDTYPYSLYKATHPKSYQNCFLPREPPFYTFIYTLSQTKLPENHTLHSDTYPYTLCKAIHPKSYQNCFL